MIESIALKLDTAPLNAIWRLLLGIVLYPVYGFFCRGNCPQWLFLVYVVLILCALRVLPLFFRKLIKFSPDTQKIWSDRRQLAKIYDSFQWRKLFWIGVGSWTYLRYANVHHKFATATALLFTVGGAIGLLIWIVISRKTELKSPREAALILNS